MSEPSASVRQQALRYILIGSYNVLFGLAVFWLLDRLLHDRIDVQAIYWTSALLGIVNGFIFQRLFVWRSTGRWHREFPKFLAVNLIVSVTNSILLALTVTWAGFPAFPSQVVITGVLVVAAFFVNRAWVFRAHRGGSSGSRRD